MSSTVIIPGSTGTGAGVTDGPKGDITVSGGGASWKVNPQAITNVELAQMPAKTIKGNDTASAGPAKNLTVAEAQAALSLTPGTDIQAYSGKLKNIADATFDTDGDMIQFRGGALVKRSLAQLNADLGNNTNVTWAGIQAGDPLTNSDLAALLNSKANGTITPNAQAGTSYTLALSDMSTFNGQITRVAMSASTPNTVIIPTNAAVAIPVGAYTYVQQIGTGATTISPASGVVVQIPASMSLTLPEQNATMFLFKTNTDTWRGLLFGGGGTSVAGAAAAAGHGLRYTFTTQSVADTDPGAGVFKFNNATQTSVSAIYIDVLDAAGASVLPLLNQLKQGDRVTVRQEADSTRWITYGVLGKVNATTYYKVFVVPIAYGAAVQDQAACRIVLDMTAGTGYMGALGGAITGFTYNSDGSPATVVNNGKSYSLAYNTAGDVSTETTGNLVYTHTYNAQGQETGVTSNGMPVERFGYIPVFSAYSGFTNAPNTSTTEVTCYSFNFLGGEFGPTDTFVLEFDCDIGSGSPSATKTVNLRAGTTLLASINTGAGSHVNFSGEVGFKLMNSLSAQRSTGTNKEGFGNGFGTRTTASVNMANAWTLNVGIQWDTTGTGYSITPVHIAGYIKRGA